MSRIDEEYKDFDFNDKLAFNAEWVVTDSAYCKHLAIYYYPTDQTTEIFDRDLQRIFYKRAKTELQKDDLYVGNTVNILGRKLYISDYADERTKRIVASLNDKTFTICKPFVINRIGEVLVEMWKRGYKVMKMRMCCFTRKEALDLYEPSKGDSYLALILEELVSGPLIAMEIMGKNAIEAWYKELGPVDPTEARKVAPNSMRSIFGGDSRVLNGFHAAKTKERVLFETNYFFPKDRNAPSPETKLKMVNTTCCVIKPHAVKSGLMGPIFIAIKQGNFHIYACQMIHLTPLNAEEFLEVYKGVVTEFDAMMESFLDGPCMVLEIASQNEEVNVYEEFRKLCGPHDPEIARQIRPHTLRARFGINKHINAVHCTDLPEDVNLDLEYCFKIMTP